MRVSKSRIVFSIFNLIFMISFCLAVILPFMNIIAVSLSGRDQIIAMKVGLWPKGIQLESYRSILEDVKFQYSIVNTIFVTAAVTILSLVICIMAAYAFSKKFYGKTVMNYFFILAMYFSGGLIPFYLLMTNYLRLYNSYLALILPALVNVFYIIVIRTQIEAIPQELQEAAIIDGATEAQTLFMVVIPSILPTIAAIAMFIILGTWNSWFNVMLFTNKEKMWMLQYYLRAVIDQMVVSSYDSTAAKLAELGVKTAVPESIQRAAIILVAAPVVAVYPFVQKYFVKGILVGSVKG